jgi:uncharacterized integral membrane protein
MKIIVWLARIILFLCFFVFAVLNTSPVTLNYVLGQSQAPLALVLLLFFLAGTLLGMAVLLPSLLRQRAEIRRSRARFQSLEPTVTPAGMAAETHPQGQLGA